MDVSTTTTTTPATDEAAVACAQLRVDRTAIVLRPNNSRVVIRPFQPADDHRVERIIGRICALSEVEVERQFEEVMDEFRDRHQKIRRYFLQRYECVRHLMLTDQPVSEARRLLIGAYFTQEYAFESAALFNPSMVWAPDQSGLPEGSRRFIISLRATGEGHISSITFRSGVVDRGLRIQMDEPTRFVTAPEQIPDTLFDKVLFFRKLVELRIDGPFAEQVLETLEDQFTDEQLEAAIGLALHRARPRLHELEPLAQGMRTLVGANYEVAFEPELNVSERIIFPNSPTETNGIEDARFVEFRDDDGSITYYATYTAFDGKVVLPQILETKDFLRFKASTLNGPEVRNKGMALFPRKVNGLYAMLSRQDNENIFLMYSDMLHFWYTKVPIAKPTYAWEFVQLGNCGSPIETDAGWLVLTHGVGAMRKYAMGAFLLDKDDPSRLIGRLEHPLLEPNANEREGYVPNVVYSCGGVVHDGVLIIPYAMSDYASTFATIPVDDIIKAMV
ncbi:glycoside hydrolase family 130 protein [Planctomyces sp. SH-PL62]|uniref:glycoside hydrolase family 130 protein n=1 Tax=Planctomyces sp. SH-PL62 TaxID=1636152 RepID=UPI00078DC29C|nr:glycoside hydrolase family 130 protein [Planctomyces sp. SH-PL62]AMV37685.1 Beta-1,4-mannooligosaccharide phosphorylase [Planctomyces sp. SH-PL62]